MNLYYTVEKNGYHIFNKDDSPFHAHQYEPYIPDKSKSYVENVKAQISELLSRSSISVTELDNAYKDGVQEA